jgi:hypothetical protein
VSKSSNKKPGTDWEAIEREYRAGQLSEAEIARQHNISRAAIQKRAKKHGWSRDLTEKVQQEIRARLVAEGLQVARGAATIDAAATRGVQILRSHQELAGEAIDAVRKLIAELHATLAKIDEIEADVETSSEGDKNGKRKAQMKAAVALPSRAQVAATLATALKTMVAVQREAFNINGKGDADPEAPTSGTVVHKLDPASAELLKRLVE